MKVKFFCCTHDFHSEDESDVEEFPDDTTDEELVEMAEEFFWNSKKPNWWFKRVEDK